MYTHQGNLETRYEKAVYRSSLRFSIFLNAFSFVTAVIHFVTPFWLVSWPRVHTPFQRLGLWEVCTNGFVTRKDQKMVSYYGCWWIFASYYDNIREYLIPVWFGFLQAFVTLAFLIQIACLVLALIHLIGCCGIRKQVERRVFFAKILMILEFVIGIFLLLAILIFAFRWNDPYWMPDSELNWPSWSYGCCILSCFASFFAVPAYWNVWKREKMHLYKEEDAFPLSVRSAAISTKQKAPEYESRDGYSMKSIGSKNSSGKKIYSGPKDYGGPSSSNGHKSENSDLI